MDWMINCSSVTMICGHKFIKSYSIRKTKHNSRLHNYYHYDCACDFDVHANEVVIRCILLRQHTNTHYASYNRGADIQWFRRDQTYLLSLTHSLSLFIHLIECRHANCNFTYLSTRLRIGYGQNTHLNKNVLAVRLMRAHTRFQSACEHCALTIPIELNIY